jgi:transposase InsO family protein
VDEVGKIVREVKVASEPEALLAVLKNPLHRYNWHRPHGSLKANTPISRLGLSRDNLLRLHT